jgi:hypothetical protein
MWTDGNSVLIKQRLLSSAIWLHTLWQKGTEMFSILNTKAVFLQNVDILLSDSILSHPKRQKSSYYHYKNLKSHISRMLFFMKFVERTQHTPVFLWGGGGGGKNLGF